MAFANERPVLTLATCGDIIPGERVKTPNLSKRNSEHFTLIQAINKLIPDHQHGLLQPPLWFNLNHRSYHPMHQFICRPRDHSLGSPRDENPYGDISLGGGIFPQGLILICRDSKILPGGPHPNPRRYNTRHQLLYPTSQMAGSPSASDGRSTFLPVSMIVLSTLLYR